MINPNSDGTSASTADAERDAQQKSKHGSGGKLTFIWRRGSREDSQWMREDSNDAKLAEHKLKNASTSKMSFGFFRSIKKHLQIKNLCKSRQNIKETEAFGPSHSTNQKSVLRPVIQSPIGYCNSCNGQELPNTEEASSPNRLSLHSVISDDTAENCHNTKKDIVGSDAITQPSCSNAIAKVPNTAIAEVPRGANETLSNDNRVKASLAEELLKLSKYGWYWGPISGYEADVKLVPEPDGAFLVRDSSDDRYVLTLSFKSSGKILHARMEHSGGLFSLCNPYENEGFTSVAALINHSMNFSQSAIFCYSRPRYPGYPSFPVRLTKPVSRFTQVRSLQYLCRFVIRQNTRLDNIHKLPLPKTIKGYIEETHY